MTTVGDNREVARLALEQVCACGDMTLAPQCYAEDFADHVGDVEYHGLEGVRRSTASYRALLDDLRFDVVDQIAEGDRVASRWVLTGSNRGRTVRLWGITISRLRDGRIVEDWSAFDSAALLRALGLRRTLFAAPLLWRGLRATSGRPPTAEPNLCPHARYAGPSWSGSDGTRTRDLRRDALMTPI
jgi:predicted ester cyclase